MLHTQFKFHVLIQSIRKDMNVFVFIPLQGYNRPIVTSHTELVRNFE